MRRFALAVVVGASLAGCQAAAWQYQADPQNFVLLVPGQSTIDDATRLLGPPIASTTIENGKTLLQWVDYYHWPRIHLVVAFDAETRLIEVRHVFVD